MSKIKPKQIPQQLVQICSPEGELSKINQCQCGGTFEIVESNPPYNDAHFQCNQCDGTKI